MSRRADHEDVKFILSLVSYFNLEWSPGKSTLTGCVHPSAAHQATAAAQAPVPHAQVAPAPRSQTMSSIRCGPTKFEKPTLTPSSKMDVPPTQVRLFR